MRNLIQPGDQLTIAAPYAVDAGEGVLAGSLFGVAFGDAENGATVDIATVGVFDLAKASEATFTLGAPVYFEVAGREAVDAESDGDALIGVAVAAAGAGATTVRVRLGAPVALV